MSSSFHSRIQKEDDAGDKRHPDTVKIPQSCTQFMVFSLFPFFHKSGISFLNPSVISESNCENNNSKYNLKFKSKSKKKINDLLYKSKSFWKF